MVYVLNAEMVCVEVISRTTSKPQEHQFVGARLGGGQRREHGSVQIVHPLPIPGTEAVFKLPSGRRSPFGQTSQVERVVLRLRSVSISVTDGEPAWREITERHSK